MKWK